MPYLALVALVFAWRYQQALAGDSLYATSLLGSLLAQPTTAIPTLIGTMLGDFFEASLAAWGRMVLVWQQIIWGSLASWLYLYVVFAVLRRQRWPCDPMGKQRPDPETRGNLVVWRRCPAPGRPVILDRLIASEP